MTRVVVPTVPTFGVSSPRTGERSQVFIPRIEPRSEEQMAELMGASLCLGEETVDITNYDNSNNDTNNNDNEGAEMNTSAVSVEGSNNELELGPENETNSEVVYVADKKTGDGLAEALANLLNTLPEVDDGNKTGTVEETAELGPLEVACDAGVAETSEDVHNAGPTVGLQVSPVSELPPKKRGTQQRQQQFWASQSGGETSGSETAKESLEAGAPQPAQQLALNNEGVEKEIWNVRNETPNGGAQQVSPADEPPAPTPAQPQATEDGVIPQQLAEAAVDDEDWRVDDSVGVEEGEVSEDEDDDEQMGGPAGDQEGADVPAQPVQDEGDVPAPPVPDEVIQNLVPMADLRRPEVPLWETPLEEMEEIASFWTRLTPPNEVQYTDGLGYSALRTLRHFNYQWIDYWMLTGRVLQGTQLRAHIIYFEATIDSSNIMQRIEHHPLAPTLGNTVTQLFSSTKEVFLIAKAQGVVADVRTILDRLTDAERMIRDYYRGMQNRPSLATYHEAIQWLCLALQQRIIGWTRRKEAIVLTVPPVLCLPFSRRQLINGCISRHVTGCPLTPAHVVMIDTIAPYNRYWKDRDRMELKARNINEHSTMEQIEELHDLTDLAQTRTWRLLQLMLPMWAAIEEGDVWEPLNDN